jgi:hypothetical protein
MRCPTCEKFVSYGDGEVEIEDSDVGSDGTVTVSVRVVLPCGDCGEELKECSMELEHQIEHDCLLDEDVDFELEDVEAEFSDRQEMKDRNGKPIKSARYRRTYYGATITGTVHCKKCGDDIEFEETVEESASSFDELV